MVLNTHDRARRFGVLKSLGATPGQVRTVVLASMAALVPAGRAARIRTAAALRSE